MPLIHSYQNRPGDLSRAPGASGSGLGAFLRHMAQRTGAALGALHRAIVTAKTRRLRRELRFHDTPQRPLILDDKWDF